MRVFRNDNGFDTVCRREAKTRAAADTHTYTKGTIIVIYRKNELSRDSSFFILPSYFIPNHFSATMAKEKKRASVGHP